MDNRDSPQLKLSELARRAGVTPRTIRYYITRGLLPPARGPRQKSTYDYEHYLRLLMIERLKEEHLTLAEIKRCLDALSLAEMEALLAEAQPPPRLEEAPGEYAASLLAPGPDTGLVRHILASPRVLPEEELPPGPSKIGLWRRIRLAPGVELHYQLQDDPRLERGVALLVRYAAGVLREQARPQEEDQGPEDKNAIQC